MDTSSFVTKILNDPAKLNVVSGISKSIAEGKISQDYIDFFFQNDLRYRKNNNVDDLFLFAKFHAMFLIGDVLYCDIEVGETPCSDKTVGENFNRIFKKNELDPFPFYGEFWGGTQDADGYMAWDKSVLMDSVKLTDNSNGLIEELVSPSRIPLEIGTTQCAKSYVQLVSSAGLARWPYGSETIRIFKLRDEAISKYNITVPCGA